jgi:hypothetical protein
VESYKSEGLLKLVISSLYNDVKIKVYQSYNFIISAVTIKKEQEEMEFVNIENGE